MDLAKELQKIYDSEINIEIRWFWDAGIEVRLGDPMNGYVAEETVKAVEDLLLWLQAAIAKFYPTSEYTQSLPEEVRIRAGKRLFTPPRAHATPVCPHCGAAHRSPYLDEVIAFICTSCGKPVDVEKSFKVQ